jgi:hypothetical protein
MRAVGAGRRWNGLEASCLISSYIQMRAEVKGAVQVIGNH